MKLRRRGISHRIRRKAVRRAMLPNPQIEDRFAAGMRVIFQDMHDEFMSYLGPRLQDVARADAKIDDERAKKIAEFERRMKAAKPSSSSGDWSAYEKTRDEQAAYIKTLQPDASTQTKYIGPKDGAYGKAIYSPYHNTWTVFRYKTEANRAAATSTGVGIDVPVIGGKAIGIPVPTPTVPKLPAMPKPMVPFGRYGTELQTILGKVTVAMRPRVIDLFNKMSGKLDVDNAKVIADLIGIDVRKLGISHVIDQFRDKTIQLVEDAGRTYAKQVREVFEAPDAHTLRVEELRKKLLERADVSTSRADLIARDQVLKMNGQITASRQQRAGVTQYEWSTSQDQRVREDHAALEGTIQDWNNPPVVDEKSGRREHPGQDYQCRCVAIPVIPGLEED